jgi:hypothetical protein
MKYGVDFFAIPVQELGVERGGGLAAGFPFRGPGFPDSFDHGFTSSRCRMDELVGQRPVNDYEFGHNN